MGIRLEQARVRPSQYRYNQSKCACGNLTGHKTGLCETCRTRVCVTCGKTFISYTAVTKRRCSVCERKFK